MIAFVMAKSADNNTVIGLARRGRPFASSVQMRAGDARWFLALGDDGQLVSEPLPGITIGCVARAQAQPASIPGAPTGRWKVLTGDWAPRKPRPALGGPVPSLSRARPGTGCSRLGRQAQPAPGPARGKMTPPVCTTSNP